MSTFRKNQDKGNHNRSQHAPLLNGQNALQTSEVDINQLPGSKKKKHPSLYQQTVSAFNSLTRKDQDKVRRGEMSFAF